MPGTYCIGYSVGARSRRPTDSYWFVDIRSMTGSSHHALFPAVVTDHPDSADISLLVALYVRLARREEAEVRRHALMRWTGLPVFTLARRDQALPNRGRQRAPL
jgi:hypothetical protein